MKKLITIVICLGTLAFTSAAQATITVDVYAVHTQVDGGAPYSTLVGSFQSADIMFATNTGYNWHPFGLLNFGAEMTGCLAVEADGGYSIALDSDDGSMLYIDGVLVVNNGGPHAAPQTMWGTTILTTGEHSFRIEFFNNVDLGGWSGVDLILPNGVTYTTCDVIPAPGAILLGSIGVGFVSWLRRRRTI